MKAAAKQPVAVAIDAGGFEFQFYSSGIFTGSCGTELDHGVAAVGTVQHQRGSQPCSQDNGYEDVPANNEAALMKAVAKKPVAVAIDAGVFEFQFYSSGIFTGSCGTELDHGVAAVYGENNGMKYWLVKNSWGIGWGEEGYIRMRNNVDAKGRPVALQCKHLTLLHEVLDCQKPSNN
ncbi:hypothetical protein GH714_034682 [Hevea brasiliensis]|uniref:Peptidase C1A papain C-terminal domain-containing protein n=1 Tax=Hevea brasiliensis TaxID=3981 RepID=A0A6A6MJ69_HEVBR|nr:hypothetical protein GH714_034682 [Hevea brasiliensis]